MFLMIILSSLSAAEIEDKIYINENQLSHDYDRFYILVGDNVWIETNALNRDEFGLFTFSANVASIENSPINAEYVKKWRCPHCNKHWPLGTACQNLDCPSRYK